MSNESSSGPTDLTAEAAKALLPRFRGVLIGPNDTERATSISGQGSGYNPCSRSWARRQSVMSSFYG